MAQAAKTEAEHLLHGTKSQKRFKREESYVEAGRPRFPKGLTPAGKKTFKRLCSLLEQRRALTEGDVEALKLYCVLQDRHGRALLHLELEGEVKMYTRLDSNGQPHQFEKENIWHKVAAGAEKQMVAILVQLGLTPKSKDSIKPTRINKDDEIVPGSIADVMPELLLGLNKKVTPIRPEPVDPREMDAGGEKDGDDELG